MNVKNILIHDDGLPKALSLADFQPFANVLVQVFAATGDLGHLRKVLSAVKNILPQSTIIGCSTDGTIDNGKIHPYGQTIQLTVTAFEHTGLRLAYSEISEDAFTLGRSLAERLISERTKAVISFSEAASVNGEHFLEGIDHLGLGMTVAGGVASTPTFTGTFVIADDRILTSGAAAVALDSDVLRVYRDFIFGWEPIGREMTVTKVKDNVIDRIDNYTPLAVFRHYLGNRITDALPGTGSAFPLLLKRDGHYIARGIIALDGESFVVSGNVKKDDKVFIGYGDAAMIAQNRDLNAHLQKALPSVQAVFNYYCEGRRLFLPDSAVEIEAERLSENGPTSGCFTLGEFYTQQKNVLHNFSSTILALSEESKTAVPHPRGTPHVLNEHEKLSALVTRGLFHLIDVRTKELEHQSYHDALTELPNRTFFGEMLSIELEKAKKKNSSLALFFLDIDHFKDVNDTLGHGSGDLLLQSIAQQIRAKLKPSDFLARWSGDEFVILRHDSRSIDTIVDLATDIISLFDDPVLHDGHYFSLGISIGISLYPNDGRDAESLIKNADAAMYAVKFGGRNHFSFYRKEMTEKALERITLENDLRIALKERSFFLVYQPQIDIESGLVRSAEALLRWNHPEKGVIMPETFIGVAEKSGLILPLGELIFDMALQQFRVWQDKNIPIEKICINVSAKQFRYENIIETVERYLHKYALSPSNLEIELTESTLMKHSESNLRTLDELHRIGVSISIDDFGTGYSSLSYLKRFKINNIKIDKSFVENLPDNANDGAIVKAIIAMAQSLGIDVIVEGIENSRQKTFMLTHGCRLAQGYYYSEPVPADRLERVIHSAFPG